jgi:dolichol-phosphate mannosyltransferase
MPIRLVSVAGLSFTILGGLVGFGSGAAWLSGRIGSAAGYALLTTVLLIGFGCVMLSLGILGEYLWRALDQARTRPRYIVSEVVQPRGGDTGQDMTGIDEGEREQTPVAADDFVSVP